MKRENLNTSFQSKTDLSNLVKPNDSEESELQKGERTNSPKHSLSTACRVIRKKYKIKKKDIYSLADKELLKKSDIYKIACCLIQNISTKDEMKEMLESKRKTWKKYIDYFMKSFDLTFSTEIPIDLGIFCAYFILFLDRQGMDEERIASVNKIRRKIFDNNFSYLNYDEKNDYLNFCEHFFDMNNLEKYGIQYRIDSKKDSNGYFEGASISLVIKSKKQIQLFEKNQVAIEMLAEIENYQMDLDGLIGYLRYNTAVKKRIDDFEQYIIDEFNQKAHTFFQGWSKELQNEMTPLMKNMFNIEKPTYEEEKIREAAVETFRKYVSREIPLFEEELLRSCEKFRFDPEILLKLNSIS